MANKSEYVTMNISRTNSDPVSICVVNMTGHGVVFYITAQYANLVEVSIDGNSIEESNYSARGTVSKTVVGSGYAYEASSGSSYSGYGYFPAVLFFNNSFSVLATQTSTTYPIYVFYTHN